MLDRRLRERRAAQMKVSGILGLRVLGSNRAADMEMFELVSNAAPDQLNEQRTGSFALHVQAPWHLSARARIVVGYRDLSYPRSGHRGAFDPNVLGSTSREERLEELFERERLVITGGRIDRYGGLQLKLTRGYALRVFPDASDHEDEVEHWRLLERDGWHVVSSSRGLEILD